MLNRIQTIMSKNLTNILTKQELKYLDVAKAVAKTSDFKRTHVGCCIVYNRSIISVASNSEKSHPLQSFYNRYRNFDNPETAIGKLHAEIHALSYLLNRDINYNKVSLFVYRELKDGSPAISRPCPACERLIKNLGIKKVYYIDSFCNPIKEVF